MEPAHRESIERKWTLRANHRQLVSYQLGSQPGRTADTRKTIVKKHRALRTRTWQRAVLRVGRALSRRRDAADPALRQGLPEGCVDRRDITKKMQTRCAELNSRKTGNGIFFPP